MTTMLEQIKPNYLCKLDGCNNKVRNKKRKFCSKECHKKSIEANIPKCGNHNGMHFEILVKKLLIEKDKKKYKSFKKDIVSGLIYCHQKCKRGRNHFCSWECYKIVNDVHAHETCQRQGCSEKLISRKSTRKYCSQTCYRLDHPNRPLRKVVRYCQHPECDNIIKRRGTSAKYCSTSCAVKSRKTLIPITCPTCEHQFSPTRSSQTYCSDRCRTGPKKEFSLKTINNRVRRYTRVEGKWELTANVTWQKHHNSRVPKGKSIWFIDGEIFNDMDINNLYLVDHKEYLSLSRQMSHNGWTEEYSDVNTEHQTEHRGKFQGRIGKSSEKNIHNVTSN